jgi:hypothetical protein
MQNHGEAILENEQLHEAVSQDGIRAIAISDH